jgi:hypothetical protein
MHCRLLVLLSLYRPVPKLPLVRFQQVDANRPQPQSALANWLTAVQGIEATGHIAHPQSRCERKDGTPEERSQKGRWQGFILPFVAALDPWIQIQIDSARTGFATIRARQRGKRGLYAREHAVRMHQHDRS